ncbi:MAG: hypothetical protein ACYC56_10555 [Candidatus Aquicultor sp.]
MKKILLAISFWLLTMSFVNAQEKPVDKDSTELATLTKQKNELAMRVLKTSSSLYEMKKQIELDEKNLELAKIDLQVTEYAISKQEELIKAKKSK